MAITYSKVSLKRNLKAMGRSMRASMAPVPRHTGHEVIQSMRRHLQKLKSGTSSGLSYLTSALASTAGGLACCKRPVVMDHDFEALGADYGDYENGATVFIPASLGPKHAISAAEKQVLPTTCEVPAHHLGDAAVNEKMMPDNTAYCFEGDTYQLEANEPLSTTEDMAAHQQLWSLQSPMPLAPGSSSAEQELATWWAADDKVEDITVTWDGMVMATTDFATLKPENQTCMELEDETASLFGNDNDPELQRQERQQALALRAAAAAAQGDQHKISAEQIQAIWANAKADREAAAAERAAQLQQIEAALQEMTEIERACYFEAQACPNQADTDIHDTDNWNDPEILALLASRGLHSSRVWSVINEQRIKARVLMGKILSWSQSQIHLLVPRYAVAH